MVSREGGNSRVPWLNEVVPVCKAISDRRRMFAQFQGAGGSTSDPGSFRASYCRQMS
jgi:hypothetical protein